jgi:hypothetical protein
MPSRQWAGRRRARDGRIGRSSADLTNTTFATSPRAASTIPMTMAPSSAAEVLRPKECQRHDGDPVGAPVGGRPGGDDDRVKQVVAEAFLQPAQMSRVIVVDDPRELHLDADDALIGALDDEVDLPVAIRGSATLRFAGPLLYNLRGSLRHICSPQRQASDRFGLPGTLRNGLDSPTSLALAAWPLGRQSGVRLERMNTSSSRACRHRRCSAG